MLRLSGLLVMALALFALWRFWPTLAWGSWDASYWLAIATGAVVGIAAWVLVEGTHAMDMIKGHWAFFTRIAGDLFPNRIRTAVPDRLATGMRKAALWVPAILVGIVIAGAWPSSRIAGSDSMDGIDAGQRMLPTADIERIERESRSIESSLITTATAALCVNAIPPPPPAHYSEFDY